jgi:hypothetical protein
MSLVMSNAVRTLLVVITGLVGEVISVRAQQSELSSASLKIRAALQSPQQPISVDGVPVFTVSKPDEFRVRVLTFLPPDAPGQFVRIRVPVGALASRAVHSIADAHHRRAENAARDDVARALAEFQRAQPK